LSSKERERIERGGKGKERRGMRRRDGKGRERISLPANISAYATVAVCSCADGV